MAKRGTFSKYRKMRWKFKKRHSGAIYIHLMYFQPKNGLNNPSGLGCRGVLRILAAHLIIRLFLYFNQSYRVILNDEFVGCDADVKGVDFGPPGSLRLSLLDSTKVGQDLERKEEGGIDKKRKK